jgi:hypothetical protein
MRKAELNKVVEIVFRDEPLRRLEPEDVDTLAELLRSRRFADFGMMVFDTLLQRCAADLATRRALDDARNRPGLE